MDEAAKKEKEKNVRDWDNALNLWSNHGCPADDPEKPIPGPHPEADHLWNKDKQAYADQHGIPYKFDGTNNDEDVDDY